MSDRRDVPPPGRTLFQHAAAAPTDVSHMRLIGRCGERHPSAGIVRSWQPGLPRWTMDPPDLTGGWTHDADGVWRWMSRKEAGPDARLWVPGDPPPGIDVSERFRSSAQQRPDACSVTSGDGWRWRVGDVAWERVSEAPNGSSVASGASVTAQAGFTPAEIVRLLRSEEWPQRRQAALFLQGFSSRPSVTTDAVEWVEEFALRDGIRALLEAAEDRRGGCEPSWFGNRVLDFCRSPCLLESVARSERARCAAFDGVLLAATTNDRVYLIMSLIRCAEAVRRDRLLTFLLLGFLRTDGAFERLLSAVRRDLDSGGAAPFPAVYMVQIALGDRERVGAVEELFRSAFDQIIKRSSAGHGGTSNDDGAELLRKVGRVVWDAKFCCLRQEDPESVRTIVWKLLAPYAISISEVVYRRRTEEFKTGSESCTEWLDAGFIESPVAALNLFRAFLSGTEAMFDTKWRKYEYRGGVPHAVSGVIARVVSRSDAQYVWDATRAERRRLARRLDDYAPQTADALCADRPVRR